MEKSGKALVVLSGGQDSTTCLYWAKQRYEFIDTITFDYGQRHRIEVENAKYIADMAKVNNTLIPINSFHSLGGNSLTEDAIPVKNEVLSNGMPNTFVPGRNLIFLTFAAAYAYQKGIHDIITGVCETDFSGYPDCRLNTIEALESAISLGMEFKFRILTPLMFLSKAESIQMAKEVGALPALAFSHTCYNGEFPPCQTCPACLIRAKGFSEAGIKDPLIERIDQNY